MVGRFARMSFFLPFVMATLASPIARAGQEIDENLYAVLKSFGFEGKESFKLETRLGRPLIARRVELGRSLFFDKIMSLKNDNSCSGCHAPQFGFGDSQSIAIGIDNNDKVGPGRVGPRNQRRTPTSLNVGFYPRLMWNTRFNALSDDSFDGSKGFEFPRPETTVKFAAFDKVIDHLLVAQGHMPSTEFQEMAGFTGLEGKSFPVSRQNGATVTVTSAQVNALQRMSTMGFTKPLAKIMGVQGDPVPGADSSTFNNEPIRMAVIQRIQSSPGYLKAFQDAFPEVRDRTDISFALVGSAIAEFELSLNFADAPIDQFARGSSSAMSEEAKKGALLFFGKANCVTCHAVQGKGREMFSDFENHNIAVPAILSSTNNMPDGNFKGPGKNEDFGREDISESSADRYKFRTSPLRNVALQPAFFHDGAYTKLQDAIRHHLDVAKSVASYDRLKAGVAIDIDTDAPMADVLATMDPRMKTPSNLSDPEVDQLVAFVRDGLTDARATKDALCSEIPRFVLSMRPMQTFEGCPPN